MKKNSCIKNSIKRSVSVLVLGFMAMVLLLGIVTVKAQESIDVSWQTDIQRSHKKLSAAYEENARMCLIVKHKIQMYKKNMRDDVYARKTLQTYETRLKRYCDPISKSQEGNQE